MGGLQGISGSPRIAEHRLVDQTADWLSPHAGKIRRAGLRVLVSTATKSALRCWRRSLRRRASSRKTCKRFPHYITNGTPRWRNPARDERAWRAGRRSGRESRQSICGTVVGCDTAKTQRPRASPATKPSQLKKRPAISQAAPIMNATTIACESFIPEQSRMKNQKKAAM